MLKVHSLGLYHMAVKKHKTYKGISPFVQCNVAKKRLIAYICEYNLANVHE